MRFVDVGSGSGIFSLAARRLGAQVFSFDFDIDSVRCTEYLRDRYSPNDPDWEIRQGSILDETFVRSIGTADIVYAWGVLHHTGDMYCALANTGSLVDTNGCLVVAIYNDQGRRSRMWKGVKRAYNVLPRGLKWLVLAPSCLYLWAPSMLRDLALGKPFDTWRKYRSSRGMGVWHDTVDWVGGYPFEVATPEQIFRFYRDKRFQLIDLKTCLGGHGCNEFVFVRTAGATRSSRASE
jgi:2-polyprenyl-6-hydroxyphenyl methylase/3-demethylubiquinone-9 3-methyltransferase